MKNKQVYQPKIKKETYYYINRSTQITLSRKILFGVMLLFGVSLSEMSHAEENPIEPPKLIEPKKSKLTKTSPIFKDADGDGLSDHTEVVFSHSPFSYPLFANPGSWKERSL